MRRHGGRILADQLKALGVRRVFSIPGESYLAALDGLYDSGIDNIVCRHEGGAAMMAEAAAKLTGETGVCFVTRGPGATNASAGVHVARQDSTPMVLFVGQVARGDRDREVFQEVDYRAFFGGMAKWVGEVDATERLPEYIARAFRLARSGRPGPVVLSLPEDMLSAEADVPDISGAIEVPVIPSRDSLAPLMAALHAAERPLLVVGGPHWDAEASGRLARFAEAQGLPVAAAFRRQSYLDNRHPNYAGDLNVGPNPKLAQRVREADCLLILGTRFSDVETAGYSLVDPAAPAKTILHIHSDGDEIGRVYGPDHAVVCPAPAALEVLAGWEAGPDRSDWVGAARADYLAWGELVDSPGAARQERIIRWLSDTLPDDAIVTNGAGNFAAWLHRYFVFKGPGTQAAPTSGSMGYGIPAAVSASLIHPGRKVVCIAGDGDAQMTLNELGTAAQYGATPIVVVMNNRRYGTIRMHQERTYPGRVSGTELVNPDFAALARAYGGHGERVDDDRDFPDAFARAEAAGTLAVIEVTVDDEAVAPGLTLGALRAASGRD